VNKVELTKEEKALFKAFLSKLEKKTFRLEDFCFDKQLAFVTDPSPFATAVCSVRAGKTVGCAADLVHTALGREGIVCLYLTLNRLSAKRIVWADLLKIVREYNLGAKINESELSLTFPNKSVIYISGAKDKSEIEKFRGLALALCYIDECQAFRDYIRELVDEVIAKRLFDYAGRLRLIGTPGAVPVGYFYECSVSSQWSHHHWTMFDNPWLPIKSGLTHEQILQRELDRKGVTREDPSIQRECFGRWAFDPNALVFRYNDTLNHYDELPKLGSDWNYVLGVDLGFDDSDAICALAWHEKSAQLFLVEEEVRSKQGITELAQQLDAFVKRYNPTKIVMDTGGLGKKIAEEVTRRFAIPIQPAEKQRKFEYIELLNDAMRTKKFLAKRTSRFAGDCKLVEWDRDTTNPEKPKIKDTFHSDICDAVLYAFREAYHWTYKEAEAPIKPYTERWYSNEQEMMWKQAWERQKAAEHEEDLYYEEVDYN
jgi:hypothetical protein